MKVYPIGYSTPGAQMSIDTLMQDERTMLVDIRYSTTSKRKPEWSRTALHARYGMHYLWIRELGNVNYYNGGSIELFDAKLGIVRLLRGLGQGYNLILLCTCREYEQCHRKTVVDLLLKEMPAVEVVQPDESAQVASDTIMALSIRQPYAHWLSNPAAFIRAGVPPKTIENRDWNTHYRGPLLIHASATFEKGAIEYWIDAYPYLASVVPLSPKDYTLGAIVGIADLVDVVIESSDPWFCGTYGFVLANARPIEPIPYRGALKLFGVPRQIVEQFV